MKTTKTKLTLPSFNVLFTIFCLKPNNVLCIFLWASNGENIHVKFCFLFILNDISSFYVLNLLIVAAIWFFILLFFIHLHHIHTITKMKDS